MNARSICHVATVQVYVLESGKLAEYDGLLDQLVECNGQASSSVSLRMVEVLQMSHAVARISASGHVQKVERHSRQVPLASLQHVLHFVEHCGPSQRFDLAFTLDRDASSEYVASSVCCHTAGSQHLRNPGCCYC